MSPFVLMVFTLWGHPTMTAVDMPSRAACERELAAMQQRDSVTFRRAFCIDRREAPDAR